MTITRAGRDRLRIENARLWAVHCQPVEDGEYIATHPDRDVGVSSLAASGVFYAERSGSVLASAFVV